MSAVLGAGRDLDGRSSVPVWLAISTNSVYPILTGGRLSKLEAMVSSIRVARAGS